MEQSAVSQTGKGLSGNALKIIAMVCMLIDHVGAAILEVGILGGPEFEQLDAIVSTSQGFQWYLADMGLRFIGRLAFPIFCFCLTEGFVHTKNFKKYAGSLFVFALVSEIPFDLAFSGTWLDAGAQNIFFTLFISLLVLAGVKKFARQTVKQLFVIFAGCLIAQLLKTDYGFMGVAMVLVIYMFRRDRKKQMLYGALMAAAESIAMLGAAALSFLFIRLYNGERGKLSFKYLFYWFYPAHLVLLYLLRLAVFR